MSPQVECFDDKRAELELKKCPKIVCDYVKLLKIERDKWKQLSARAIGKLKNKEGTDYLPAFKAGWDACNTHKDDDKENVAQMAFDYATWKKETKH